MAYSRSRSFVFSFLQDFLILGAIALAIWTRFRIEPFAFFSREHYVAVAIVFLIYKGCFHYFNLYQINLHLSLRQFVNQLLTINIIVLIFLTVLYFFDPRLVIGRGILALCVLYIIFITGLHRFTWGLFSQEVAFSKNLLILGAQNAARVVLSEIEKYRHSGYKVVGLLAKNPEQIGTEFEGGHKIIGSYDDLFQVCMERDVDLIVVAMDDARGNLPLDTLLEIKVRGVDIQDSSRFHEQFTGKIVLEGLRASWFIFSEGFTISRFTQVAKRGFDLTASLILLVLTFPICVITALLIKLTGKGPILYKQERVGLRGQTFMLYKFRSMRVEAEDDGPKWAESNDPRVTWIGRFIRRFRIDEIPQIFNVAKGEMSFVGPRPERPFFVGKLSKIIPFYSQRHLVKPGITGWAQVRYAYGSTIEDAKEKLQLDLYYIKNISLAFDMKILLETTNAIFKKMAH